MTSYDSCFFIFSCYVFVLQALPWLSPAPRADAQGGPDVPWCNGKTGRSRFRPRLLGAASGERNQHETCENQHDDMIHNSSCFFANSSVLQELCKPAALA